MQYFILNMKKQSNAILNQDQSRSIDLDKEGIPQQAVF
jgi:hypothetical protein